MMGQVFGAPDDAGLDALLRREASSRDMTVGELRTQFENDGVPYGTPDMLGEFFDALTGVGVDLVYFQMLDVTDTQARAETWDAIITSGAVS
jgi:hypothetical protein